MKIDIRCLNKSASKFCSAYKDRDGKIYLEVKQSRNKLVTIPFEDLSYQVNKNFNEATQVAM